MLQNRVDMLQTGLWTIAHGNGHGTIQIYNRRRPNSNQLVVKRNNLPPVGRSGRFCLRMNGRNRSLQCVCTEAAGVQGFLEQCHSLRDLLPVPERAVLIFQQNQLSGRSSVSNRPSRIASPVSSARVTSVPAAAE